MHYVYVLENRDGKHYIGSCEDIGKRLKRHNQNAVASTKNKGPFRLVYKEKLNTVTEARKRENQLKRYKGNKLFKRLIDKQASPSSSLV